MMITRNAQECIRDHSCVVAHSGTNVVSRRSFANTFLLPKTAICYRFWLFGEREAAEPVFADAAEVERAVVFDNVRNLGVAIACAVLEVCDDVALRVEREDEGVMLRSGLQRLRQTIDHLAQEWMRQQSIEKRLTRRHERDPKLAVAI